MILLFIFSAEYFEYNGDYHPEFFKEDLDKFFKKIVPAKPKTEWREIPRCEYRWSEQFERILVFCCFVWKHCSIWSSRNLDSLMVSYRCGIRNGGHQFVGEIALIFVRLRKVEYMVSAKNRVSWQETLRNSALDFL